MMNVFSLPISELAEKIRNSQLTSKELCEYYISQIDKFEKDVKAWAYFDKKLLLEKATEADTYRKSGKPMGLLHGIPAKVNLIPFNEWPGAPFECSSNNRMHAFADIVNAGGFSAPIRVPRGRDILAACGQLKSASERARNPS